MGNTCKLCQVFSGAAIAAALAFGTASAIAGDKEERPVSNGCAALPSHSSLTAQAKAAVSAVRKGFEGVTPGLGNDMWATVVSRDGAVCAVARTGADRGDQWPGSRVISAQKANTANLFSLRNAYPNAPEVGRALASGNLYGLVQPGGSLFGLQFSNPIDTSVAYKGPAENFGQPSDPMVGHRVGGVNVFGGGLPLYDKKGNLLGGLGVSGDTSCNDHIIAWIVRDALDLDHIPGGVADGTDNLILKDPPTANTFEHPLCGFNEERVIPKLPTLYPRGP
jgi:uncharacterized protein GlcG (DUF336 family)